MALFVSINYEQNVNVGGQIILTAIVRDDTNPSPVTDPDLDL